MNLKTVAVANLKPHQQNPNTHPAKQIDELAKSLTKFTQVKNVVIWNDRILAGHGVVEAATKAGILTLEAQDVSHWPEDKATEFMLADIRLPGMAIVDDGALVEALRAIDAPLDIPGFDEGFLKGLDGFGGDDPPEPPEPQIDRAAELQEKWQCETGQTWQIESATNPGQYHRLICGDCRDTETVKRLTEGRKVNGVFTSPPYAMQRAKQYGGVEADKYVDWWEAVQENVRGVLAEDGSFFVNIKPHCKDGQRVLYVFDLVLAMARRWGWRFVEEYNWVRNGVPRNITERFRNSFEPVYHFSGKGKLKIRPDAVKVPPSDATIQRLDIAINANEHNEGRKYSKGGFSTDWATAQSMRDGVYPDNVLRFSAEVGLGVHVAPFPLKLPTFFIKAYSDKADIWLDPFVGSGTTMLAAENEARIGYGIEQLPKYCAVILERLQAHTGTDPELIK